MVGSLNFFDIRDTRLRVNWTEPQEINGVLQGISEFFNTVVTNALLMLSTLGDNFSRQHFEIFFLFFPDNRF